MLGSFILTIIFFGAGYGLARSIRDERSKTISEDDFIFLIIGCTAVVMILFAIILNVIS